MIEYFSKLYQDLLYKITIEHDLIDRKDLGVTDFEIVMCNGDYKELAKMLLEKIEKAPNATEIIRKEGIARELMEK